MDSKMYTPREVAEALNISPTTVCREVRRGSLQAVKIGRCIRIFGDSVELWLERSLTSECYRPVLLQDVGLEESSMSKERMYLA